MRTKARIQALIGMSRNSYAKEKRQCCRIPTYIWSVFLKSSTGEIMQAGAAHLSNELKQEIYRRAFQSAYPFCDDP